MQSKFDDETRLNARNSNKTKTTNAESTYLRGTVNN